MFIVKTEKVRTRNAWTLFRNTILFDVPTHYFVTGAQVLSLPSGSTKSSGMDLSPISGPVISLARALSHSSVFAADDGHSYQSGGGASLSRKLSIGPHERVEIEKLTSVGPPSTIE